MERKQQLGSIHHVAQPAAPAKASQYLSHDGQAAGLETKGRVGKCGGVEAVSGRQQQRAAWSCAGAASGCPRQGQANQRERAAIAVSWELRFAYRRVSSLGSKLVRMPGLTRSVQGGISVLEVHVNCCTANRCCSHHPAQGQRVCHKVCDRGTPMPFCPLLFGCVVLLIYFVGF